MWNICILNALSCEIFIYKNIFGWSNIVKQKICVAKTWCKHCKVQIKALNAVVWGISLQCDGGTAFHLLILMLCGKFALFMAIGQAVTWAARALILLWLSEKSIFHNLFFHFRKFKLYLSKFEKLLSKLISWTRQTFCSVVCWL